MVDGFAAGSFWDGSEGANGHWEFAIINEGTVFCGRDEMFIIPKPTTASNTMWSSSAVQWDLVSDALGVLHSRIEGGEVLG